MTEFIIELDGYEAYKAGENLGAIDESEEFYGEIVDEIVRCRDCAKLNTRDCPCAWYPLENQLGGFCAWGEYEEGAL